MKIINFIVFIGTFAISTYNAYPSDNIIAGKGSIKGIVYDTLTNTPLEYATIAVIDAKTDSIIDGTVTETSGRFKLKNIKNGVYNLKISFIGYEALIIPDIIVNENTKDIDLGSIKLKPAIESLDEVVVVSDLPTITYKIDKKIINVGKDYTSEAGTAVDVLQNYPSIEVGINGDVSLRGSSDFIVLIDNKPTVLEPSEVLNQIPVSSIDNIEIITNPSAKYDSEGASGIINIITKKNMLQGFNGILKLSGGMFGNRNADILLSVKKENVDFFIGAHTNKDGINGGLKQESRTITEDTVFYVTNDGDYALRKGPTGARGGIAINLNQNNDINLQFNVGKYVSSGTFDMDFSEYTQPALTTYNYNSEEDFEKSGLYYDLGLNYNHKFIKEGHEISALIYYDKKDFDDRRDNDLFNGNNIINGYRSLETGPVSLLSFQVDYTLPLGNNNKLELGYKSAVMDFDIVGEVRQYNQLTALYELDSNFLYDVRFDDNIHSGYSTFSGQFDKLGYQLGLRAEYTDRKMSVKETTEEYLIGRLDFFPGVHLNYSLPKNQQIMASYTRRINRPENWKLEPFYTWHDAYNVRIGNPSLEPEYINAYELSYLNRFGKSRLSFEVYYREITNAFERIRGVYDENIYVNTYKNVGDSYSLGAELSLNLSPFKWWNFNLIGDLYNYSIEGELYNQKYENSSINWSARFQNNLKLTKTTNALVYFMYRAPSVTPQGEEKGYIMTNVSLRQEFLKNFSANLQVTGIFGMLKREMTYNGDDFYIKRNVRPYTPIVKLTLSYTINNYKYNKKHKSVGDMDDGEGTSF